MSTEIWTILRILNWTKEYFEKHGIGNPRLDAELLIAHTLDIPRIKLYTDFERPLNADELVRLKELIRRRVAHEPIAYILGAKEFYSERFSVNRNVLVPRPETELIIDEMKKMRRPDEAFSLLDVGTGSGCIAIMIKKLFPNSIVMASDISSAALDTAALNAENILGSPQPITFILSDIFEAITGTFDIITCNPPYIPTSSASQLDSDVRDYEPSLALFGGADGLDFYRLLLRDLGSRLNLGGVVLLETGVEVIEPLKALVKTAGFSLEVVPDYQKIERIFVLRNAS